MIKKIICMVTIISITLTTVVASFASEISPDGLNQKEKFDYISEQDIPSFI